MMGWGRRWRKARRFGWMPPSRGFYPTAPRGDPVTLTMEEFEALRLVDYLGMTQEEAGKSMGVSRGTVWRALSSGRRKVVQALVEGRPIIIV